MPICDNCGTFVTKQWARTMLPDAADVPACPFCPDRKWDPQTQTARETYAPRRAQQRYGESKTGVTDG